MLLVPPKGRPGKQPVFDPGTWAHSLVRLRSKLGTTTYRGCSVKAYPAVTVSVASLVGASSRLIGPLTDAGDTAALS